MKRAIYVLKTIYYFFLGILAAFIEGLFALKKGLFSLLAGVLLLLLVYYGIIYSGIAGKETLDSLLRTSVVSGIPLIFLILGAFFLAPIVWVTCRSLIKTISYTKERFKHLKYVDTGETQKRRKKKRKR